MNRTVAASIAPFFDRLCGADFAVLNGVYLDARGFQKSLLLDLSRLLNTRCHLTIDEYMTSSGHVMNYGLPSLSTLTSNSKKDLQRLAQLIQHAIKLYEPRLKQLRVNAVSDPEDFRSVQVEIQAAVIFGEQTLRFAPSFHLFPGQVELVLQPETA
ncbi:MAG: type VI secretion system baseplate subunit TssE [Betaproteobacteria bacterium]|nr:type VI secretion system baseplate subunit TssE [Betaproteobacteria bacterium]NBY05661.1 type VI secretion system baseplate subunit TssE [Betaproteobacteria bacterium]